MSKEQLRESPMMARLMDAMDEGTDVGHYGRLTFVMVARHFLEDEEMVSLLTTQPEVAEKDARMMIMQTRERNYNPPKRDKILEWQSEQDFAICPTPDDPASCNVYSELTFPDGIYDNIEEYYEEKVEAQM